jgi:hypothetical protein
MEHNGCLMFCQITADRSRNARHSSRRGGVWLPRLFFVLFGILSRLLDDKPRDAWRRSPASCRMARLEARLHIIRNLVSASRRQASQLISRCMASGSLSSLFSES